MRSLTYAPALSGNFVERRDLLLPRGVWQLAVRVASVRVFLLVTSTGAMLLHRLPEHLFADDASERAVLDALAESLHTIDPQLQLLKDVPDPPAVPGPLATRIMQELGYQRAASVPPSPDL